jgi:hypothetical protein
MHSCTLEQRMNVSEFLSSRQDNITCVKRLGTAVRKAGDRSAVRCLGLEYIHMHGYRWQEVCQQIDSHTSALAWSHEIGTKMLSEQNSSQEKRAHAQVHKPEQTYTITYTCIHAQIPAYTCAHTTYISANTQMVRPVQSAAVLSACEPYQALVDRVELNWRSLSCVFCGQWQESERAGQPVATPWGCLRRCGPAT